MRDWLKGVMSMISDTLKRKMPLISTAAKIPLMYSIKKDLLGLSPNLHIHVSVSDFIFPESVNIFYVPETHIMYFIRIS
jgi:hypothetical protein